MKLGSVFCDTCWVEKGGLSILKHIAGNLRVHIRCRLYCPD